VEECGLFLMHRTQSNMDERVVVFLPLHLGKKTSVFILLFFFGRRKPQNFTVTIYFDMGVAFYQMTKKMP